MSSSLAPVAVSVVGAGLIGARHVAHVAAEPTTRLHSVVDPTQAGRALAAAHAVPWFPDIAAMLAAGKPDAAIVATPNRLHVEHGLALIAAGVCALVEKPLADDLASGARLVAAAERAGVALLTGHHRRHNPLIARAKALIEEGRLGRIVAVHGFFWLMKPDDYFDAGWRREPGAGPILLNLIHDVDLMRHLCGEIVEVQALVSNAARGFAVEDTAAVLLRFANGALGTISISDTAVAPWSWEMTAGENPAYPPTGELCLTIGGARGSLSIPRLDLWSYEGAKSWFAPIGVARVVAPPEEDALRLQARQLARVARGLEPPLVSGRDGLATLRVVDAISRAAREGGRVAVGD